MSELAFLEEDEQPTAAETQPEPAPEPQPEAPEAPVEEPEPQPEPEPAPEPAPIEPVAPVSPQPGTVPLTALLDTRDKLRAAEQELAQYRQQQIQPQAIPDQYADPDGFATYQAQMAQEVEWNAVKRISFGQANRAHGEQTVQEALDAFMAEANAKPWLHQEIRQQFDPFDFIVQRHKQQQVLQRLNGDPIQVEQFLAWQAAQASVSPQQPAAPPISARPPSPSLAREPSAGGVAMQVEPEPFEAEFRKKG